MKSNICFIPIAAAALLSAAEGFSAVHLSATTERVPGEIVVKLRNPAPGKRVQANVISSIQSKFGQNAVVDVKPFQTDSTLYTIKMSNDGDIGNALAALQAEPSVEIAEPNIRFHALDDGIPTDPDFGKLWGIKNTGQADAAGQVGTPGADINIVPLWEKGFRGSKKVLVAVIDTGIDLKHPDLAANIYTNPAEIAGNGKDDDGNGFIDDVHGWNFVTNTNDATDDQSHGSHVSGTIAAVPNNGIGVAGINWEASLLPVKFLDAQGGGTLEGAVQAIQYAIKMKAKIINASWGGGSSSEILADAVKQTGDAGILFVAAAGNDGANNDSADSYPANYQYPNMLSVAATDNQDKLATFSNYGAKNVHVAAPGVKIYSCVKDGGYAAYSGTSMATPHVVGISALLLGANPEWSFAELKDRLIRTSDPKHALSSKVLAKGRVNAYNAFYGIVPPSSEPKESDWIDVARVIESEHPYPNKADQTFKVSYPGAKYIRVHFEKIQTEAKFDVVNFESVSGEILEKLSGNLTDRTTDYVVGDTAVIRLKSDLSVNSWGFRVDKIQVIR